MNFLKRFFSAILLTPLIIFSIFKGGVYFNLLLLITFLFGFLEIIKLNNHKIKIIIFVLFMLFLFLSFKIKNLEKGEVIFFGLILISWLSDIGGYFFGKFFGGKKINFISPNKTYAGFFGSILFSQLCLIYFNFFNYKLFEYLYLDIISLIICSLLVILGDLFFSYCKRICQIKDYSNIIPGHGGLFDRIDGLIFLIIFYYLIFIL